MLPGEAKWVEDVPVHRDALLGDPFTHKLCGDGREQNSVAIVASSESQSFEFAGAEQRKMVGRVWTEAAPGFDDFRSGESRDEFLGGREDLLDAARRYSFLEANVFNGAAGDNALRSRVIPGN